MRTGGSAGAGAAFAGATAGADATGGGGDTDGADATVGAGVSFGRVTSGSGVTTVVAIGLECGAEWQPVNRPMASTATKQPGKQCIKRFASCINFLWTLRLSLESGQRCCDPRRIGKQKAMDFYAVPWPVRHKSSEVVRLDLRCVNW